MNSKQSKQKKQEEDNTKRLNELLLKMYPKQKPQPYKWDLSGIKQIEYTENNDLDDIFKDNVV